MPSPFGRQTSRSIRKARHEQLATIERPDDRVRPVMVFIGLIYLLLGILVSSPLMSAIGLILLVVGVVLMLVGRSSRQIGRRAQYR